MKYFLSLLSGVEDNLWYLDLKNGNGSCGKGKPEGKADCTISMDYKSLLDLVSGLFSFSNSGIVLNGYSKIWCWYHTIVIILSILQVHGSHLPPS